MRFDWSLVIIGVLFIWMAYVGWALHMIVNRPLWPTVNMTYMCENDGKHCDWKWPTQTLGK